MRRRRLIPFPAARHAAGATDEALVEVRRCDHAEALIVRSLFESEGIPTLLRSRLAHSVHPFTVGAQGEVAILVPKDAAARAAGLLTRIVRGRPPA
jgi:hypothetical protein